LYDNIASRVLNVIAGVMSDFVFDIINTLRTGSFKLFKRPFLGFLTILTL